MLITVSLTAEFLARAKAEGMTASEIETAVNIVAANPTGGVSLGGGLYKVRVPREGAGKSGGYRVISLYVSNGHPAVLLSVISKGNAANFTDKALKTIEAKAKELKPPR